ncbi:3-oxoacyl-ACP reductase FabG [Fangia hongkongensis]|uniref:3-oxoacyl-ACP reductase FabG n=1 Tax=Fangia hongkongensis TaxID=270495 RepID=UPI000365BB7B|nr:3-oxoacyl-ACP reductase FabG [Fangia hongkongensis]MBK2124481.1 3-oxoacyl-ACP reductase FabG [Fangia hongkongensis]
MSFNEKVILVTGASRGIGKAIAKAFLQQGATVIGTATSESGAQKIEDSLKEYGNIHGQKLNITSIEDIKAIFDWMKANTGLPDVLVNNAGITKDNLMMRLSEEDWLDVLHTNLDSVFHLSKAAIRHMMKKRNGRIITIGSVVGSSGNPGQANYCASKAGVIGFSKSLAQEVASRNITVNVVAPGFIQTDMTDKLTDEQKTAIMGQIPSQKLGSPQDIAEATVFLASEGAHYITGQTLHVNGGMYMV